MSNSTPTHDREQAPPADIHPTAGSRPVGEEMPTPAPAAIPAEVGEDAERPMVNPVTGGAL